MQSPVPGYCPETMFTLVKIPCKAQREHWGRVLLKKVMEVSSYPPSEGKEEVWWRIPIRKSGLAEGYTTPSNYLSLDLISGSRFAIDWRITSSTDIPLNSQNTRALSLVAIPYFSYHFSSKSPPPTPPTVTEILWPSSGPFPVRRSTGPDQVPLTC